MHRVTNYLPALILVALLPAQEMANNHVPESDIPVITVTAAPYIPRTSPAAPRIQRAESAFQAGKRLLQEGKIDAARTEFDRALDILLAASETNPDRHLIERKAEELIDRIYRYDLDALGAAEDEEAKFAKSPLDDLLDLTFPVDPNLKEKAKLELSHTSSQLPLDVTDAVLSYMNFFTTTRGRNTLVYGLKRSGRYRDMISRILAEEGVPQEMIFLAQAESAFTPRAVSRKAACGMWQFVSWRGREYGLNQTSLSDERLDPEKATRAAARHLKDLYDQFGDWYLAMAAYNCGPGCVDAAVRRTGYADFWELRNRNALPRETSNYVPIILAMTLMAKNAKEYGLDDLVLDPPASWERISFPSSVHLPLIADAADVPLSTIKELNPQVLGNVAPAGLDLYVPAGSAGEVKQLVERVPAEKRAAWRLHRSEGGESLDSIAKSHRLTAAQVAAANQGVRQLAAGDVLLLPVAPEPVKAKSRSRTPSRSTKASSTKKSTARKG